MKDRLVASTELVSGQNVTGGRVAVLSKLCWYEDGKLGSEALELDGDLLEICRSKRDERNFEYRAGVCLPSKATSRELRISISRGTIKRISRCCFSSRSGRSVRRNSWRRSKSVRAKTIAAESDTKHVTYICQKCCGIGYIKEIRLHGIT